MRGHRTPASAAVYFVEPGLLPRVARMLNEEKNAHAFAAAHTLTHGDGGAGSAGDTSNGERPPPDTTQIAVRQTEWEEGQLVLYVLCCVSGVRNDFFFCSFHSRPHMQRKLLKLSEYRGRRSLNAMKRSVARAIAVIDSGKKEGEYGE